MTSWTECGCGGDVILHENPGEERYGRTWNLLTGNCRSCGRYHETVPGNQRLEFHIAREQWEKEKERQRIEQEARWEAEETERIAKLSPQELLNEVGEDRYPWIHLYVQKPGCEGETHLQYLTKEDCQETAHRMALYGPIHYRIEGPRPPMQSKGELLDEGDLGATA